MASKLQTVRELSRVTLESLSGNMENWTGFLHSAASLYKYPFHDQLLIHAQRPDATACASFDLWNRQLKRYINKGAKGIALVDDSGQYPMLRYVFDVADTNTREKTPFQLWEMREDDQGAVLEELANHFGDNEEFKELPFVYQLQGILENAIADNITDYIAMLNNAREGSSLEALDEIGMETVLVQALEYSVGYICMTRLSIDANAYYAELGVEYPISAFDTPRTITCLGRAASDMSEMALRQIERTVRENQLLEQDKFAKQEPIRENEEKSMEGSVPHEQRSDIYTDRGLSDTQPDVDPAADRGNRQIWEHAQEILAGAEAGRIQLSFADGGTNPPPDGDRAERTAADQTDHSADGAKRGRDGSIEGQRPDGVGTKDEQYQESGGGDGDSGIDPQLGLFPSETKQIILIEEAGVAQASAFYVSQEDIDYALTGGSSFHQGKFRIYLHFQEQHTTVESIAFLKKEYGIGGRSWTYVDGRSGFLDWDAKGYQFATRGFAEKHRLTWNVVAKRLQELIAAGRYLSDAEMAELPVYRQSLESNAQARQQREDAQQAAAAQNTEDKSYHFSLGDSVQIGRYSHTILALAENIVVLSDPNYPLLTVETPRAEFERRVRENPENDHLIADTEEFEQQAASPAADSIAIETPTGEKDTPEITPGTKLTIDERQFVVDIIDGESVSLRDITFEGATGFPIFRSEPLYYVRKLAAGLDEIPAQPEPEQAPVSATPIYQNDTGKKYQIGMGHLGNGLTVWNRLEEKDGDYVTVAHIGPDRQITYYDSNLPELIRDEIEKTALTSEMTISTSQDTPIFNTPPQSAEPERQATDNLELDGNSLRERLARVGIVDGQLVDEAALDNSPFIRQVSADVEKNAYNNDVERYGDYEVDGVKMRSIVLDLSPVQEREPQEPQPTLTEKPEKLANFRIIDDTLGHGGQKAKYGYNAAAIRALKQIEAERRHASPEEQEILSRYVGWGGIPQAFDENNNKWAHEYAELKGLLTEREYEAARATTLNAHYTSPTVIKSIYETIERMGFQTGNILEPSMGVGNFFGLLPESMQDSKLYGVEIDSITGRIAQQLYPNARIAVQGYEDANLPDSFFDVAVGNVPFGGFGVIDKRYEKNKFLIHDYFFAKTLDKVRPSGIVAFITSKGTLDKKNPEVRKYIAQRAELLGAVRLPNNAFAANAGTEVTTDILFLQKRERPIEIEPDWVHLAVTPGGVPVNSYYVEHPHMMLGTMAFDDKMYGNAKETTCNPIEGANLAEQLMEALSHISGTIPAYTHEQELDEDGMDTIPADPDVRNFSYTVIEDKIYYREDSVMRPVSTSITGANRIKGMVELRDCMRTLIDMQLEDDPDEDIIRTQQQLSTLYDAFTAKYGIINSRGNEMAFSEDSGYFLLCSLEVLDDEQNFQRKADMFTKRTIKPHIPITSVETPSEALAVSISECGKVDMDYMAELTGLSEQEIVEQLEGVVFRDFNWKVDGSFTYRTADDFLSGNVREKLQKYEYASSIIDESANHYQAIHANIAALRAVQPKDLSANEIDVRLGASWLPPEVVKQFMDELFDPEWFARERVQVQYSEISGNWNISNKSCDHGNEKVNRTYGTKCINAYRIVENTLNLRDVRIYDTIYEDGKEKRVLNAKETVIAQQKQQAIKDAFQDWIWKDPDRREQLTRLYNDTYNCIRQREYDGSHLTFPGMNPEIKLRPHQVNAVARALYGGNTLLAHCVGAGKTYTMAAIAMESKRLGLSHKSMIVVPNHIVGQFAGEFLQLYPSANILVATKKDFEPGNRKKFCARIATGEYDAVVIGHSQFEKVPMSLERQRAFLENEIDELMTGIREAKREKSENFTIKQMEATRKSLDVKLKKLNSTSRKDNVIDFEALGVDRLFVDEADNYKNLFLQTKMHNVAGIPQTEAQKSSDMFMKSQYINEITENRGMIFATGTPISNSMIELYTMQRYLQFDTLRRYNLQHFDAWASTFGERVTAIEIAPEGTGYRAKTRFAKFFNLPELLGMFRLVADIQTKDMLDLPIPKVEYHNVALKPSELQREMVKALAERAENVRKGMVPPTEDNMLRVTNDGRKLALDQRLMNAMLPDDTDSKTNACVTNVYDIWERTAKDKLTQLVFCDLSTPKGDGSYNVYEDMREKLIAKGIPAEEIAFIHDANTDERKVKLFAQVRSGQVRVLLGSTAKMGAGTNAQTLLVAEHHLDCPWRPRDIEQREGRIERQGNTNDEVHIYRYVTESTFDSYMWQTLEGKQRFISQIMTSKTPARSCEDVDESVLSFAEVKALAAGDPDIKERMQLDTDIKRLSVLKSNYLSNKYELEDSVNKTYPAQIEKLIRMNEAISQDMALYEQHKSEEFPGMELCGMQFRDKANAGAALIETCKAQTDPKPHLIGQYCGFSILAEFDAFMKCFYMSLSGNARYRVELGTDAHGNIQRLDNQLKSFPDKITENSAKIKELERQRENAKEEMEKPFPQEFELKQKQARLAELDAKLKINEKGNEAAIPDTLPEEARQEREREDMAR